MEKDFLLEIGTGFFEAKEIKKLRQLSGGDRNIVVYLKIILEAIKTEGVIRHDHIGFSFPDDIALTIGEATADVSRVLKYLISIDVVEGNLSDSELKFLHVAPFEKPETEADRQWGSFLDAIGEDEEPKGA